MDTNKPTNAPLNNKDRLQVTRPIDKVMIETPIETRPAKVTQPKNAAAGWVAVYTALEHIFRAMTPIRGIKGLLGLNQKHGYDCPGCAWPDPDGNRHLAEFCENGAKAVAEEATTLKATPEKFGTWSIAQLSELSDFNLGKLGRITDPLVLREGSQYYAPISWDEAFRMVADELRAAAPDEAVFYTSGKASNEAAFLYQLLTRLHGTNNLPDCSNMCHESSGLALLQTVGIGKGTVKLDDFNHADCIVVVGQNPGTNHPRMLTALQHARRNGAEIISINPLREAGLMGFMNPQEVTGMLGIATHLATLHLPVRINGDLPLYKGLLKEMLEQEAAHPGTIVDQAFVDRHTTGFEEFAQDIHATPWDQIVRESGISREQIRDCAHRIMKSKRLITCWAMGLTQHKNAVGNIQEIVNMHLMRGMVGKQGAGLCPVRGHSNVQGDRTVGIWEQAPDWFLDKLGAEFGFAPPRKHGFDTVDAIEAMHAGKVKVFVSLGGNFLGATPDTAFVAEALRRCKLTVHIGTKPNRAHLVTGKAALILPCLGRTERDHQKTGWQFLTTENSMGVVEPSQGHLKPISANLKSEVAIICGIGEALFETDPAKKGKVKWRELAGNYDLIRDHIEHVVPGFTDYNTRIKKERFFYLPNAVRDQTVFNTDIRKARFTVHAIDPVKLETGQYLLMTIRTHDQFNTTIYGEHDRYRGIHGGRRVLFMNADDIREAGFKAGDAVDITSHFQGDRRQVRKFAIVPYEIPRRCVASYYPEANPLAHIKDIAVGSRQPVYKSIVVTLEKAAPTGTKPVATTQQAQA